MHYAAMKASINESLFHLLKTTSRVEKRFDRALSCTKGVSFTEYQLLKELNDSFRGSATRVDLARAVNLTPSAITRALKPLEKIGFVVTEKSDRDARRSLATLTRAGQELLDDASKIVQDEINALGLAKTDITLMNTLAEKLSVST